MPVTYEVVKLAGAGYLAFLAWQMARPGERHRRPRVTAQRLLAGTVLGGFAIKIATSAARP